MRAPGWEKLLAAEIERARNLPFAWGSHDCSLFACDVVKALTGVDHGEDWRGKYKTEKGAAKLIAKAGGLRQIATNALGEEISPLMAQRGDVVMAMKGRSPALGICIGRYCAFTGAYGLVFHSLSLAVAAWRVA